MLINWLAWITHSLYKLCVNLTSGWQQFRCHSKLHLLGSSNKGKGSSVRIPTLSVHITTHTHKKKNVFFFNWHWMLTQLILLILKSITAKDNFFHSCANKKSTSWLKESNMAISTSFLFTSIQRKKSWLGQSAWQIFLAVSGYWKRCQGGVGHFPKFWTGVC